MNKPTVVPAFSTEEDKDRVNLESKERLSPIVKVALATTRDSLAS